MTETSAFFALSKVARAVRLGLLLLAALSPAFAQDDIDFINAPVKYSALLVVDGDRGVGSGFLAQIKDRYFAVTNIHVLAGNSRIHLTTAEGQRLERPEHFFIAKDRDVAIFPIAQPDSYYEVPDKITQVAKIDDLVTVYGNEGSATVVTRLEGKILGIGPDRIEVDAAFIPGNSGSPILHEASGQVIGIATYILEHKVKAEDPDAALKSQRQIRRFAERLDMESDWQAATLASLNAEAEQFAAYDETVMGALDICYGILRDQKIIQSAMAREPVRWRLERFHDVYDKARQSNSSGNQRALDELKRSLVSDMESAYLRARKSLRYGFFQRELERTRQLNASVRDFLEGVFSY